MVNLGQVTSLLSAANPFSWLKTVEIWVGIAIVFGTAGYVSGCEHKQREWDATKLAELGKTKNAELKDAKSGITSAQKVEQDKQQTSSGQTFVRQEIAKNPKPLIIVKECEAPKSLEVHPQPGTKQDETNPTVFLSGKFMQLYDVSIQPFDSELRTRTYGDAEGPSIDEGFEKAIIPNNEACAKTRQQLVRLINRINEKKKIFEQE